MKGIRDNTRQTDKPVLVEFTVTVTEAEAFWLVENSEAIGSSPQQMASQIISDVIHDDILAHREEFEVILH